jgi:O-acetylserine/cysteine efflux transporter
MRPRDILLALCPPVFWGLGFTLGKPAVEHFPPLFMMAMTYAAVALCLFRPGRGLRTPIGAMLAIASLGGTIQAGFIFYGLAELPAGTANLVLQSSVPFAILCAWAFGKEQLNLRRLAGIAVALAGVVVILGMPESPESLGPLLLVVAGALSWAIAQAIIRVAGRDGGRMVTGTIGLIAAPQCLILSLLLETGQGDALRQAHAWDWLALAGFVVIGFVVPYSVWYHLVRRFRIDQVLPFSLLMPVTGVVSAAVLLGERVGMAVLIGGAVIIAGLAIVVRAPAPALAEG